ncbi:MAG: 50S ribosomal protein L11 methyltransferase [Sphingomonadaceae bacterium]
MSQAWKVTLPCTRGEAEAINEDSGGLADLDAPPALITAETGTGWEVAAYFDGEPDDAAVALLRALVPSARTTTPKREALPDQDWVTLSQAGLAPVHAGRFYVHTSTNKRRVPPNTKSFLIEAARAFGTGGHDTTAGCLDRLDRLKRSGARFDHIVDLGTGTGLLAFAALHLWPRAYVSASDIDPVSVDVAAENAVANGIALGQQPRHLALCVAAGTDHELIARRAPYDLVIANILAGPLIELAPAIAMIMRDGGSLILAGLLADQVGVVTKAYRHQGLRVAHVGGSADWPCLHLRKRARFGWQRRVRTDGRTSQLPGDFGTW